ncbi:ORF6C domain-containing protein, partial [Chengkuizengella axinellae]
YTTVEAMKMKVKFIEEFKRMKENLQNKIPTLTGHEALAIAVQQAGEMMIKVPQLEQKIDKVDQKVDKQITLTQGEQRVVQRKVCVRVYSFTKDRERRSKLFRELYRDIKDRWGVPSYRDVLRKDMKDAINYINAWVPKKRDEEKGEIA